MDLGVYVKDKIFNTCWLRTVRACCHSFKMSLRCDPYTCDDRLRPPLVIWGLLLRDPCLRREITYHSQHYRWHGTCAIFILPKRFGTNKHGIVFLWYKDLAMSNSIFIELVLPLWHIWNLPPQNRLTNLTAILWSNFYNDFDPSKGSQIDSFFFSLIMSNLM